jgi:hypothetical protein
MTPQSTFMILAPIVPDRAAELRRLLASMNDAPGRVNANNPLIPFGQLEQVHVARLVILDDQTTGDVRVYGLTPRTYPLYLALLGNVDGDPDAFLEDLAGRAAPGLRAIFSCCEGFAANTDPVAWMKAHSRPSIANYVNWRGRTVRRVREEAALREALERHIDSQAAALEKLPPVALHQTLRHLVTADIAAGRLTLSPEDPTPLAWRIRNLLHLVGVPLLILLLSPLLLLASPLLLVIGIIFVMRLRHLEKTDPELCPRVDETYTDRLAALEDHDVTNQFTAMGSVKPGIVRLTTVTVVLWLVDYFARHVFTRGQLGRIRTIHFARWVFLDNRERVVFCSDYDGSVKSYMDDFINKVGFGLNLSFSSGIGYPRTNWLVLDGCADERKYEEFLRRHTLPTEVWYKAYPGLTAIDLERNGRIRQGVESSSLSDREAHEWTALL